MEPEDAGPDRGERAREQLGGDGPPVVDAVEERPEVIDAGQGDTTWPDEADTPGAWPTGARQGSDDPARGDAGS